MPDTIVRGTARRLGITRPLPTRQMTAAEAQEQFAQRMSQSLIGVSMFMRKPELVTEEPVPATVDGEYQRRTCESCGYWAETHRWVTLPRAQHYCRRDDVTVHVVWPGRG